MQAKGFFGYVVKCQALSAYISTIMQILPFLVSASLKGRNLYRRLDINSEDFVFSPNIFYLSLRISNLTTCVFFYIKILYYNKLLLIII